MKVFRELIIRGTKTALQNFLVKADQQAVGVWSRSRAREAEVERRGAFRAMYCFSCTSDGVRPECELWLATRADGQLYVSNIFSPNHSSLSYDQYNSVLLDFYNSVAISAAEAASVEVQLTDPEIGIDDLLFPETAKRLRFFSGTANRSFLHSLDEDRWYEFVASAHREGANLDSATLKRWLIEEEKWPESTAAILASRYSDERALLKVYESRSA